MAAPILSPPPLTTPLGQKDGTPSPTWARWLQQLQTLLTPKTVYAEYFCSTSQSIAGTGAFITVNYDTAVKDDSACVTPGASWVYTAQADGVHNVSTGLSFNSTVATGRWLFTLMKNGSEYRRFTRINLTSQVFGYSGAVSVWLNAGDQISIAINQTSGSTLALDGASNGIVNWVAIARLDT